jgi:hypothetical protein
MSAFWKLHRMALGLGLVSAGVYAFQGYLLERESTLFLWVSFAVLFAAYLYFIQREKFNFRFLLGLGIGFRLLFITSEPFLSQDFYRFIWDGLLVWSGYSPYQFSPNELMALNGFELPMAEQLHAGMGELSAKHFSNYPPLNQLFFALAVALGGKTYWGTLVAMRVFIIAADVGTLYFGRKLLRALNIAPYQAFWYFLNPLVIVELSGNLHFEGIMIFFFCLGLYFVQRQKWIRSSLSIAASISLKLVPLLFMPLWLRHFKPKRLVLFYAFIGAFVLLTLMPLYSAEFLEHYQATIRLWFGNFEFNAGLYNLAEYIAIKTTNIPSWKFIQMYGQWVPAITIAVAFALGVFRNNEDLAVLIRSCLYLLTVYFFISTTVHPWYLCFLVFLGSFTNYRFPLGWSALVILSYSAYADPSFKESSFLLGVEYFLVFGLFVYEFLNFKKLKLRV